MSNIYLRDIDCAKRYNIGRSTWWRWVKNGAAPAPKKLGPSTTRWRLSDIEAWEEQELDG